jgi:hypothetical protein
MKTEMHACHPEWNGDEAETINTASMIFDITLNANIMNLET